MASIGAAGWLSLAGGLIELMGQREGARAAKAGGERKQLAAEFNAWNLDRQAGIATAIAQRNAEEEIRQGDVAASRALAVAAASGAGASDPTIAKILADTKGMAAYRASVALYEGDEQARQFRIAGISERLGGVGAVEDANAQVKAYRLKSMGTIARTGVSLYTKYGAGGPKGSGDAALIADSQGTP